MRAVPTLQIVSGGTMRIVFLNLATTERSPAPQLRDVRVRRAIAHAIDRQTMSRQLVGEGSQLINAICFPTQFGCDASQATVYDYNPAKAKELLAEVRRVTPQPVRHVILTHYHADHIYGLQALKAAGAGIVAHAAAREYLNSDAAARRLEASRSELAPWIDAETRLVQADRWLDAEETTLVVGGTEIRIRHLGPAHTSEDLAVYVPAAGALFVGDLVFRGRVPFVGQADSRRWIASLDRLIAFKPSLVVPGHGPVSREPLADLQLTRDYLVHLRKTMGEAAKAMEPFDEAYAKTDWSRFEHLPLFRVANRMNAYNTYLLMEQQGEP